MAGALLAVSATGTAAALLASPAAPADVTFPLLLVAVVPLGGFVALELRRPLISRWVVVAVATGLLAMAVVQAPHGSHDVWSYAMYGRIVTVHHANPYIRSPADFSSDPAFARVSLPWRHSRSVYGPGFTLLSAGIMTVAGGSAAAARMGFQSVAAAAILAVGLVLARRRVGAAVLAAVMLNPLMLVWVANGGHNDPLVGLCLLLATLTLARRPAVAGVLLAAAVLVKAVAVLPAVAAAVWLARHCGRRAAATLVAAGAMPVLAGYAAFGGLAAIAPVVGAGAGGRQSRISVWHLLPDAAFVGRHVGVIATGAVLGLTLVLVLARLSEDSAVPVFVASLAGYLLVAGYILPWYFAWVLPVAALDGESALVRWLGLQTVAILVAYQYRALPHRDGLDWVLQAGVAAAQVLAVVVAVALLAAAWSVLATRRGSGAAPATTT